MACHYRVARRDGPGRTAGGQARAHPRRGRHAAAAAARRRGESRRRCARAANPSARADALAAGILDKLIDGDLLHGRGRLRPRGRRAGRRRERRATSTTKLGAARPTPCDLSPRLREQVEEESPRHDRPVQAVDAVEAATPLPFAEGIKREAELFLECLVSPTIASADSRLLRRARGRQIPGIAKDTPRIPIRRAAVVGAGTMGGGIAMAYANAGIPVSPQRSQSGRPRPRPGDHPQELRRDSPERAAHATTDGRTARSHRADADLRPLRRSRYRRRSGV